MADRELLRRNLKVTPPIKFCVKSEKVTHEHSHCDVSLRANGIKSKCRQSVMFWFRSSNVRSRAYSAWVSFSFALDWKLVKSCLTPAFAGHKPTSVKENWQTERVLAVRRFYVAFLHIPWSPFWFIFFLISPDFLLPRNEDLSTLLIDHNKLQINIIKAFVFIMVPVQSPSIFLQLEECWFKSSFCMKFKVIGYLTSLVIYWCHETVS